MTNKTNLSDIKVSIIDAEVMEVIIHELTSLTDLKRIFF